MGSASNIAKHEFIQPGALAKGRGQRLRVMSSLRVNVEQKTLIAKNNSCNTRTSKLNKLTNKNILVRPRFDAMEDNAEKSTLIGKNRSCTATPFNLNKPAKKSILLPPDFHPMEDNDTLYQEA
ncbi:hypothetical protein HAX54_012728 [Datura stramonium]|uniref:Uncharacterized protein n=1 Tax=Datura stramonium TaxID=4076 RepID=A0ABS8Y1E7_DATST|nr:hypothetical protein [Datura stramonium]